MRLIDADALEKQMEKRLNFLLETYSEYDEYTRGFDEGCVAVEDAPTIDPATLAPRWISVEERLPTELPKDNTMWSKEVRPSEVVLVKRKNLKDLQTAWYSYEYKCWTDVDETHNIDGVTHWRLLPEPPKEGETE